MSKNVDGPEYEVAPGITITSTDANFTEETAGHWYTQIGALAREGKYEFRGTEQSACGVQTYLYRFDLPDCRDFMFGCDRPIEELGLA